MFPTLGLFAAVRCPELSASNPGGPCKRNPCIFSHTAAPPRASSSTATAASGSTGNSKRGIANSAARDGLDDGRAKKVQKQASSSDIAFKKAHSLFTQDEDNGDVKPGKTPTATQQPSAATAGTSRLGVPRALGGSRTSMVVTGSGKVIRTGAAPALQPKPASAIHTSSVNHTSSIKGKERATASDQTAGSSRPAASVSAFTSSVGPPRLPLNTPASYFPVATRNAMIKNMYHEFIRVYENFAPKQRHDLATEHSLLQEATVYGKNNKVCRC